MKSETIRIKKDAIIDMAYALFLEYGYDETSVSQIAKHLEIAKGLVYYYFDTKEDILNAVVKRMCDLRLSLLTRNMALMSQFSQFFMLLHLEYESFRTRTLDDRKVLKYYEPRLFAQYHHQYLQSMHGVIEDVVAKGVEEGVLSINDPFEMVVMVLEGIYHLESFEDIEVTNRLGLIETALHLRTGCLSEAMKVIEGMEVMSIDEFVKRNRKERA